MTIPAAFLDELRARTPIAALIGRRVRLARSGRQHKGCCPFHAEKTPSFYVYDDHYHCFGCGAHGDAIAFITQSQGASFIEAVEQLAAEAGMQVPRPTPQAEQADRRRLDLTAVMDVATAAFRRRLFLPEGAAALAYLEKRGLTRDTIARWGLGWSGPGRGALQADLAREGVTPDQLVDVGLLRRDPDDGRVTDLFYNRVMFPIRDSRGRVISFGGRVLGDSQPKYVNGPETDLFSKRRTLFGLDAARQARAPDVLVVEGYMDVIALHQAGFRGAVAPLGTALTEDQLALLWRLSPAPVLCFDGDAAGRRAAARALETALPLIGVQASLRFMTLPAGDDPDSLIRRDGADAMRAAIGAAEPLSRAAFGLLRGPGGEPTAEARAALRTRVLAAAATVHDAALQAELRRAWLARCMAGAGPAEPCPPGSGAEDLFNACQRDFALPAQAARQRLAAMAGIEDPETLAPLIAAAPVQEVGGTFAVLEARGARWRDWRVLIAVRDGAPNPDWSDAGMAETARQAVMGGAIVDVIACDPDLMRVTARLGGTTAVLGWPQAPELTGGQVRLHETPNAWLRDGCRGAVLIGDDGQAQDWLLRCARGVTVGGAVFGHAVRAKMQRAGQRRPQVFLRQKVAA